MEHISQPNSIFREVALMMKCQELPFLPLPFIHTIFICHSIHACASQASKCLPRRCEDSVRNICNHFPTVPRMHLLKKTRMQNLSKCRMCVKRGGFHNIVMERLLKQRKPLIKQHFRRDFMQPSRKQ